MPENSKKCPKSGVGGVFGAFFRVFGVRFAQGWLLKKIGKNLFFEIFRVVGPTKIFFLNDCTIIFGWNYSAIVKDF